MLCERMGERKMGKEKESIGVVKRNAEETLGFGVFTLRDLKAGEEIVLGQWECGTYINLRCQTFRVCFREFFYTFIIIYRGFIDYTVHPRHRRPVHRS